MIKAEVVRVGKGFARLRFGGTTPLKISKAQAESLCMLIKRSDTDYFEVYWSAWATLQALQKLGLVYSFDQAARMGMRSHRVATPLGLAVHEALVQYVEKHGPIPEPSRSDRSRATPHQRKVLKNLHSWASTASTREALPLGSVESEESKWCAPRTRIDHRSMQALAELEYLEAGMTGVTIDDGRLVFDLGPDAVQVVYRMTVAGALYAGSLADE